MAGERFPNTFLLTGSWTPPADAIIQLSDDAGATALLIKNLSGATVASITSLGSSTIILMDVVGALTAGTIASDGTGVFGGSVTVNDGFLKVSGLSGGSGQLYFYADAGANDADKWLHSVNTSGIYSINYKGTGTFLPALTFGADLGSTFGGVVSYGAAASLTIATGAIAITKSYHTLVVEGGTGSGADALTSATGGSEGDVLHLKTSTSGANDTVTVTDGTGAGAFILAGGANFVMDHIDDRISFLHNGTEWCETSRSANS